MDAFTQEILIKKDSYPMESARLYILIRQSILENGIRDKCMELANFNGVMDLAITGITCLGKNTGPANFCSTMGNTITGPGKTENKMVKGYYTANKAKSSKKVSGKMGYLETAEFIILYF